MKIIQIINLIEEVAPLSLAEEWDHVGLMIGSLETECTGVITCLDLTMDVAKKAKSENCNLVLTHHPFLFHSINEINYDNSQGALIEFVVKNGITVYSAHTNLDIAEGGISYSLAKLFGGEKLKQQGCGYFFEIKSTSLFKLAKLVKEKLSDPTVKFIGDASNEIKKVYVVSGAGFDDESYKLAKENSDCFITGDIKHHNYLYAMEDGFSVIEYAHFYSEIIVEEIFASILKNINVKVIKSNEKCPFKMVED